MTYIRKVKTGSGATAVQLLTKEKGQVVRIEHIGSAYTDEDLKILLFIARKQLQDNQIELFPEATSSLKVVIRQSYSALLWESLRQEYRKLGLQSFEGNKAETKTILPIIKEFQAEHQLKKITVVADAAMLSASNLAELTKAGFTYIVGSRLNKIPYEIAEYQKTNQLQDQQILVSPQDGYRIVYQYRSKRASLDLRNIEKQITKAKKVIAGLINTNRTKFLTIDAQSKRLNLELIEKAKSLAGIKGYVTNLEIPDEKIIACYHQLFQVEASLRMAKSDLKARPVYHRKRDSIEAQLTIGLAALAISRRIEAQTGISINQFVKLLKPIRSAIVSINGIEFHADPELPPSVKAVLDRLSSGY